MSYKLKLDPKENVLWVTASGTRSIKTVLAIINEIFSACTEYNLSIVLVDVRELDGRLSTINTFTLATRHFPILRELRVVKKAAIVDLMEFEHNYRFFETLTRKRGYRLRLFSDCDAAADWLKNNP
jgi:hypothetical protein